MGSGASSTPADESRKQIVPEAPTLKEPPPQPQPQGKKNGSEAWQDTKDDAENAINYAKQKLNCQNGAMACWRQVAMKLQNEGFTEAVVLKLDTTIMGQDFGMEESLEQLLQYAGISSEPTPEDSAKEIKNDDDMISVEEFGDLLSDENWSVLSSFPSKAMDVFQSAKGSWQKIVETSICDGIEAALDSCEVLVKSKDGEQIRSVDANVGPAYITSMVLIDQLETDLARCRKALQLATEAEASVSSQWEVFTEKSKELDPLYYALLSRLGKLRSGKSVSSNDLEKALKSNNSGFSNTTAEQHKLALASRLAEQRWKNCETYLGKLAMNLDRGLGEDASDVVKSLIEAKGKAATRKEADRGEKIQVRAISANADPVVEITDKISKVTFRFNFRLTMRGVSGSQDEDSDAEEEDGQDSSDKLFDKLSDFCDTVSDTAIAKVKECCQNTTADVSWTNGFDYESVLVIQFTLTVKMTVVADGVANHLKHQTKAATKYLAEHA